MRASRWFARASAFELLDDHLDEIGRREIPIAVLVLEPGHDRVGFAFTQLRFDRGVAGGELDESAEDAARIVASGASVKEMEAAAVAWVCGLHGVPVGAVKAITDLVDSPVSTAEQFNANLDTAARSLRRTTLGLLRRLSRGAT